MANLPYADKRVVPAYQRTSCSLELDIPLGKWHKFDRNTWWPSYCSKVQFTTKITPQMSSKSSKRGMDSLSKVRIDQRCQRRSYPSVVQGLERERKRERVWAKKPMASISTLEQQRIDPPSGYNIIYNILTTCKLMN